MEKRPATQGVPLRRDGRYMSNPQKLCSLAQTSSTKPFQQSLMTHPAVAYCFPRLSSCFELLPISPSTPSFCRLSLFRTDSPSNNNTPNPHTARQTVLHHHRHHPAGPCYPGSSLPVAVDLAGTASAPAARIQVDRHTGLAEDRTGSDPVDRIALAGPAAGRG
jgi:hypothetical protein